MKTNRILHLAALALTMAACTSEEFTQQQPSQPEPDGSKGIPFTATISCNATTRAISENTTDGTLVTSWEVGDEIALVHDDSNGDAIVDKMTVSYVGDTKKIATITGTLKGSPANGDEVRLLYPYSAATENGEVRADLLNVQAGTLEYIKDNLDLRMTEGTTKLKVADGSATIDGIVSLKNQYAVVKFSLKDGSDALDAESFEITDIDGQPIIIVEPSSGSASELYVAMEPTAPNSTQTYGFVAKKGDNYYRFSKSGITIAASTYYQQTLALVNMLHTPLTLEAAVAGAKVTFKANDTYPEPKDIEYSTDGGATWTAGNTGGNGVVVTLQNVGDKVMFRGNNSYYSEVNGDYPPLYNSISCTADCYVYGNIMSLISADNFATLKQLTAEYTFYQLFMDNSFIKNHPNAAYTLELPATTLTDRCYDTMFNNCTSLVTPPALPATTLAQGCYSNMFSNCTSLATAPALPATELKTKCYMFMFQWCTSLESTPKLPAETLATSCYEDMFHSCGNLKEAWVKADYGAECEEMFQDCKSGGVLHTASTSTNWNPGTGFPSDWTIENDY